jgi:hypothetical protein
MISAQEATNANHVPSALSSMPWKQILVSAFLVFGLMVPSASAKCSGDALEAAIAKPSAVSALPMLGAAIPNPVAESAAAAAPVSIVGLWNVSFLSGGAVVDVAFDAWHSDGTEILNDYTNPIEGNVCLGVWEQTGPRTYKLKHPSWSFDAGGNLQGTVIIGEVVTVSANGNSYSGSYTYDIYDIAGNFIEAFTGTIKATRIKP